MGAGIVIVSVLDSTDGITSVPFLVGGFQAQAAFLAGLALDFLSAFFTGCGGTQVSKISWFGKGGK
jgi:hypothetical protein